MKAASFPILALAWLGDMGLLAFLGPLGRHPLAAMGLFGAGFLLMLLMLRAFPRRLGAGRAVLVIIALGLCGRLPFLFGFPPNTDLNRYIWEGAIQSRGINPLAVAPIDPRLDDLVPGGLEAVRERINHPWIASIYPPLSLLIFRGLAAVSPTPIFFKSAFFLFDLGLLALLAAGIRRRGLEPSRLLLYAANPLALVFVCGEGHGDVIQSFFLLLGWLLLDRGRTAAGALGLGLAAMAKYLSAAAAPFLLRDARGRWRRAVFFAPLLLFLPYLDAGGDLLGPLLRFGGAMHYNDAATALLRAVFGPSGIAAAALILAACLVWVFLLEDDTLRAAYLAVGCLLLFLPTLHPWYLLLIAPFLCFFQSPAWIYLQAAMLFTFPVLAVEFSSGVFQEIPWLKVPEYLPFFGLLVHGLLPHPGRPVREPGPAFPQAGISVVVPALNEAGFLGRCLNSVRHDPAVLEIIVADGGSSDGTPEIARAYGARLVASVKGRGIQIRSGIKAARSDVVLVLHADGVLQSGSVRRLLRAIADRPSSPGGCFGMRYDRPGRKNQLLAALNNLRAATTGISFGSQAQFFRVESLRRIGGFPPLMLMEDVEAALRLKTQGPMLYLSRGVIASDRRRSDTAFFRNVLLVFRLLASFLVRRRFGHVTDSAEGYYRRYYSGSGRKPDPRSP